MSDEAPQATQKKTGRRPRMRAMPAALAAWFSARGWTPAPFQREVWAAMARGHSGLLHADTGAGKTYAVWLGALAVLADAQAAALPARRAAARAEPLRVLWITPMRALAADTERALREPLPALAPNWNLASRTGDTGSAQRAAQARRLPSALVTTPESLSLLLARADARASLSGVRVVIVDEWHELLGNKRGVQVQLALARLRRWHPGLMVWGLSATLGNVDEALATLTAGAAQAVLVRGPREKTLQVDTLIPARPDRFPWAGHLGMRMLPQVVAELEASPSTLVFTNTRSQSELWYQALLAARPDWAGLIALHHGSLDRNVRDWVERGLKSGELKAVVCTSSLDLGVDFLPVARVLQIGSAKGVARLLQRAGRSGHAPGRTSRVTLVPTHSLELIEAAAVRDAIHAGRVEARPPPAKPLDVLVQHLVTVALGGGFTSAALRDEVRQAYSYRHLTDDEWDWCLAFVAHGGPSLGAYPDYRRVVPDEDGVWRVPDARLARRHRQNIGTIVSDATMVVRWWSRSGGGAPLGSVEEGFVARLAPGDCFLFGGRLLELVRVQEMTAYVRRATGGRPAVPRWNGGRMPLSSELADALVGRLTDAAAGRREGPEMQAVAPLLDVQARFSRIPEAGMLLVETLRSREGWHAFLYPFAGRHAHLGLGSLLAWRIGQRQAATFSIAVNDYGLELLSATEVDWSPMLDAVLADETDLLADVLASLNAGELAQRRFREIARVAGLVFQGPGEARKSSRQLQASSSLFYEVFRRHDADNLLLGQAEAEVLAQELDIGRLAHTMAAVQAHRRELVALRHPSPFAFPLMVERFREQLSTEKLADRIARLLASMEAAADGVPLAQAAPAATGDIRMALDEPAHRPPRPPRRSGRPRMRGRP